MRLQDIMKEIYSGLIGDYYRDKAYLLKNKETYSDHELSNIIEPKIDELINQLQIPKKKKFDENQTSEQKAKRVNDLFKGVIRYIDEKDYDKAKKQVEYILKRYKEYFDFETNMNKYSFADTIEMYIFIYYYKPKAKIQLTDVDNSELYRIYGNILAHFEEYDEAVEAYKISLKWDPVNVQAFINLGEIYYINNEKMFLETINKALLFSTRKKDLSLCYKYLANYYLEKNEYDIAISLYMLSNSISVKKSDKEIDRLENKLKILEKVAVETKKVKSPKEITKILHDNGIFIAPSKIVVGTLKSLIEQAAENKATKVEEYCTGVLTNLLS